MLCNFYFFSCRAFFFCPLPSGKIQHLGAAALCRFGGSNTPWTQGPPRYSAQKYLTCPGHKVRPILSSWCCMLCILLIKRHVCSLRDSRQAHTRNLEIMWLMPAERYAASPHTRIYFGSRFPPISINFVSRFPPVAPRVYEYVYVYVYQYLYVCVYEYVYEYLYVCVSVYV